MVAFIALAPENEAKGIILWSAYTKLLILMRDAWEIGAGLMALARSFRN